MKQKAIKSKQSNPDNNLFINVPGLCEFEKQFVKNLFTNFSTVTTAEVSEKLMNLKETTRLRDALSCCILAKL